MRRYFLLGTFIIFLSLVCCKHLLPGHPEPDGVLDGPVDGLTETQRSIFLKGDAAFNNEVFTAETGLGPVFVATSCGSCHAGDGKGHPSTTLTRFCVYDNAGNFDYLLSKGGPQLQHKCIPGFIGETIPAEATGVSRFTAPANTGLGFLEAISDADIIAYADPNDADGDGISGRPNWILPPSFLKPHPGAVVDSINSKPRYIGRFGKKAAAITLLQQTVGAYKQDMGITSGYDQEDIFNPQVGNGTRDNVPDPEVSTGTVDNVVFYLRTLKAPIQRNQKDADVISGKSIFINIGCEKCHKSSWVTGKSDISALSEKQIFPYTDLLLHDMGQELDDHYSEGIATTSEWKTPALWGLGLSANSQGGGMYLLHDGRATSIESAVQYHGGEGNASRQAFNSLSKEEKEKLIKFLMSL